MKRKKILLISIILFVISCLSIFFSSRIISYDQNINNLENISIKYDNDIINCNYQIKNKNIHFEITPVKKGKTTISIEGNSLSSDGKIKKEKHNKNIYVHSLGIITLGSFFGHCNGDISISICFYIMITLIIVDLIKKYKINIEKNLYSYKNARILGLIIFIIVLYIFHLLLFIYDLYKGFGYSSINYLFESLNKDAGIFLILVFPLAFILFIIISISNIILLKKEGKRWTNMLGIILGGLIVFITILSILLNSAYNFKIIYEIITNIIVMCITYLQCIFVGTCVLGLISAKHIPRFNKDAIIILGCQINEDGSLPKLLKSRVDRAIEFSKMQKENTNTDIIFIPSGGQGADEVMSEAAAMKNYLIENGIKKENIIIEDKSTNTYENIIFSYNKIKEKIKKPKLAFSTTNYHVLRAGIIAHKQNIDIDGIGAKTKSYYWINAFIREFIATLVTEKKNNVKTLLILSLIIIILSVVVKI